MARRPVPPPTRKPPSQVEFVGSFPGALPSPRLPEVAFVGRSNVGKSSALNALLGRSGAARVSKTPGRTQAVNLFHVDQRFGLVDLPGYGFAKVPDEIKGQWAAMVDGYLRGRPTLRLTVVLVDARLPVQALDQQMVGGLRAAGLPHLVVANKVDAVRRGARLGQLQALTRGLGLVAGSLLAFSAETGEGVDALWERLERAVSGVA
jgi:GTP-binding protein